MPRKGSVDTSGVGRPMSPNTSGVRSVITPQAPTHLAAGPNPWWGSGPSCKIIDSPFFLRANNWRVTVDTPSHAPLSQPTNVVTQPPGFPVPDSLPNKPEHAGSANEISNKPGHASPQPVAGVERGLGHQSVPLNICNKCKNNSKKKGRQFLC